MSEGTTTALANAHAQPNWKTPHSDQSVTSEIIAAAIEVHRALGPGLLEFACQAAMCRELLSGELRLFSRLICRSPIRESIGIAAMGST
jgi:hypothetical protein